MVRGGKAMRSLKNILRSFVQALALPTAVWAITITSITSCAHATRPPEVTASVVASATKTNIFVRSDDRPGFQYAVFDVPEAGEAILKAMNGVKIDASRCRGIQGAEFTLTATSPSSQTHLKRRISHEHKESLR
jgi:hypothetical protein